MTGLAAAIGCALLDHDVLRSPSIRPSSASAVGVGMKPISVDGTKIHARANSSIRIAIGATRRMPTDRSTAQVTPVSVATRTAETYHSRPSITVVKPHSSTASASGEQRVVDPHRLGRALRRRAGRPA